MIRRVSSWFMMIVCVVSIPSVSGPCRAQQGKPTIEQILQFWKGRQEKVKTARFELNREETIHKGSNSFLDGDRRRAAGLPPELEPNPPRDYLVKGTSKISLDGPKLRYSYDHQQWDPIGKRLYPERYVDTFDGRLFKFLQEPASGQKDYPLAAVRMAKASRSALKFAILPLVFSFRGTHAHFFGNLGQFQVTGQAVAVAGRPCLELVRASGAGGGREVLYLDQERDYVMVREMIVVGDQPDWQLDVAYSPDAAVGWSPRSWEYIIRAGKDHFTLHSGRNTVTRYELNPPMDDSQFDIVFPPKARVHDETSGAYVEYVIRENGEKGRAVPAALNPTYENLEKAGPRINRQSNRWVLITIWSAAFVLSLGGWIWLRWRRTMRATRDPQ